MRLLLLLVIPRPEPLVHDEFSYLLAADTFSHGRLTNPTHPMWIHFETFHELSHPTYASKFPPGMGLMLAFGQVVFNDPWAAVVISMAVLCGLITWALWAWLPPRWAILGGLVAAVQLTGTYWTESYWGGTLAAIGGALVIGALGRLMRRPAVAPSLAFGLGLVILAYTRPYEGLVLGALCTVVLLFRLKLLVERRYQSYSGLIRSVGLPIAFVLLPATVWLGYYNYRVTGHPLRMPYATYVEQYPCLSHFLWSNYVPPEPKYNHEIFHTFWVGFYTQYEQYSRHHLLSMHLHDLLVLTVFFLPLPLLLCVLLSWKSLKQNRRLRIPLMLLLFFYLGLAVEAAFLPHYFAPATVLVFLIIAAAVPDFLSRFSPGHARRIATFILFCFVVAFQIPRIAVIASPSDPYKLDFVAKRKFVRAQLEKVPGQLLVFVRYGPKHDVHAEWVYNAADIDVSRIVWARAMPGGKDEELLRYYPNRRAFMLDDDEKLSLKPMNAAARNLPSQILTQPVDKNEDGSHG